MSCRDYVTGQAKCYADAHGFLLDCCWGATQLLSRPP
jgi:hypothetical protein